MAAPVFAEELQLGISSQAVYNSNFFTNAGNANSATSFQIGPSVGISDPDGRFQYDLTYDGAYQGYVDQSGVDAWESRLFARFTFDIDRLTSIRITERFRDISNLRFSRQDIALAATALDPNQDRYFRNDLEIEFNREITRLLSLSVRVGHHWIDFQENVNRNDSQSVDVESELQYQIAAQHQVGIGALYSYQTYERALSRLGSDGQFVNGYLIWNWQVTDGVQFRMNGGPAWVRSEERDTAVVTQTGFVGGRINGELFRAAFSSCNMAMPLASSCSFDGDQIVASDLGGLQSFVLEDDGARVRNADSLTFFGGANLQATLAEWTLSTSYSRRQSTTSGDGLASSLDRVALDLEYAPPKYRWSTFVAASFDRRETLTNATVIDFDVVDVGGGAMRDDATTVVEDRRSRRDNYTAIVGVRGALDRRWSGTLEFRYRRTESRDSGISRPGADTYFVLFSVDYDYDLIAF